MSYFCEKHKRTAYFDDCTGCLKDELSALREDLADAESDLETQADHNVELQQRNAVLSALLEEVLSEVPHGWGSTFSECDLAERIRHAIQPTESGASE